METNKRHTTRLKAIPIVLVIFIGAIIISIIGGASTAYVQNKVDTFKSKLIGDNYTISFYDNYGEKSFTANGNRIRVDGNYIADTKNTSNDEVSTTYDLSSVLTITIDKAEIESSGDTIIFAGKGLEPKVDFTLNDSMEVKESSVLSLTSVYREVNKYKNFFGKKRIVVIKSQMGTPICAFEGDKVYWEVCDDLPKTTKLMVDGKPLYIHRANFQIIDKKLVKEE